MTPFEPNSFIIDHIDPLGQGVFKNAEDVFFIPKTLPGETGTFQVTRSTKGVHFGELITIDSKSEQRQESLCPHFDKCNGCAYLHTSLENEQKYKLGHFTRMLNLGLGIELKDLEIELITNNERFGYRNRVQLHYCKRLKVIGFKAAKSKQIVPIANCLLASEKVQEKIKELTNKNTWLSMLPKGSPAQGHLEVFERNSKVKLNWNKNYAQGGFLQVNEKVNELFLDVVKSIFSKTQQSILDLFGGEGNLVKNLEAKSLSVDIYPSGRESKNKFNLDLFKPNALAEFKSLNIQKFDSLIIDPPRSGFSHLDSWTQELDFEEILYVSCHPSTMIRDLRKVIDKFKVKRVLLLDFFPGTHHFEAAVYLTKKH